MNKSFKNLQLNAVDTHRMPKKSKEFNERVYKMAILD